MREDRRTTGKRGEDEACRYLSGLGHRIVARNWRASHLEVDIISLSGSGLHFVEVKSRTAPAQAAPQAGVGRPKQRRLAAAANAFLNSESRTGLPRTWKFSSTCSP